MAVRFIYLLTFTAVVGEGIWPFLWSRAVNKPEASELNSCEWTSVRVQGQSEGALGTAASLAFRASPAFGEDVFLEKYLLTGHAHAQLNAPGSATHLHCSLFFTVRQGEACGSRNTPRFSIKAFPFFLLASNVFISTSEHHRTY